MIEIQPKTRKNIYDDHIRRFLTNEMLTTLQSGPQKIDLGDIGQLVGHNAYTGMQGALVAHDTGESGTHKNGIIIVEFKIKKGREDKTYIVYLKHPLTKEGREHTHFNWHYNEEAREDGVTVIPLSGGNGRPKTHAYSEYGGKGLLELSPIESLEDAIILASTLGASVDSIRAAFAERWNADAVEKAFERFADPKKPVEFSLIDGLAVFPENYTSAPDEGAAIKKLRSALGEDKDAELPELIREAKKYSGPKEQEIRDLAYALEVAKYEGAFQKGINRILDETESRINRVRSTYKKSRDELLQELGRRSAINKTEAGETASQAITDDEIRDRLKSLEKLILSTENDAVKHKALVEKYSNTFDEKIPTVSCPVDLIEISRNLRILKTKNSEDKTEAQGYLIDQWLPEGKTFLDLRGSPITVYYMLRHTMETGIDAGVKQLLENTCAALEKEFVNNNARTKYWLPYKDTIQEIVESWQHWRILRSAADRNSRAFALPSVISLQDLIGQLQSASESEIDTIKLRYDAGTEDKYVTRQLIEAMKVRDSGHSLGSLLGELPSGSKLTGIQFLSGLSLIEEYDVSRGKLQKIEARDSSEHG